MDSDEGNKHLVRKVIMEYREVIEKFLRERDGMICDQCNEKIGAEFHIDHKIALAEGGENHLSNLRLLHSACHRKIPHLHGPGRMKGKQWGVPEEYSHLLTVNQAAKILQCHPATVREFIKAGRLSAYRVNWRYFIHPEFIEEMQYTPIATRALPKQLETYRND